MNIDGARAMLHDSVAILTDSDGAASWPTCHRRATSSATRSGTARSTPTQAASALPEAVGLVANVDDGFIAFNASDNGNGAASAFPETCAQLHRRGPRPRCA